MEKPPWSNSQLRLLGTKIREGSSGYDNDPSYDAVMSYVNGLAISAQTRLDTLDWEPLLGTRNPEVTSRPKTIETLGQKLQRDPATPLQSVQDIAGVRFEAEMSLDEQDSVAEAVAGMFNERREDSERDMRESPHSGYRAVHVWLRLPARVEIQIRTHLQGMWANMYESAADTLGRRIRYDELPRDSTSRQTVTDLHRLSAQIAEIENKRKCPGRWSTPDVPRMTVC